MEAVECACRIFPTLHRDPSDLRPLVVVGTRPASDGGEFVALRRVDGQVCEMARAKAQDPATQAREAAAAIEAKG